jgi:hypothetical protein
MENKALWMLVSKLWETGCDKSAFIKQCVGYWSGEVTQIQQNKSFKKTGTNVIKPIVETKLRAILDAEFTFAVVPKIKSFQDLQAIKDNQAIADILNDELHNIFLQNDITSIKELVCRFGLLCGFGASQVSWDSSQNVEGEIKITHIESNNMRWDANAKTLDTASYIAYKVQLSPALLKVRYCKNPDGTFDLEKCKQIDMLSDRVTSIEKTNDKDKGVIAFSDSSNNNAGLAYTGDKTAGMKQDKYVELVCMFLLDDSLYAPEKNDSAEVEETKEIGLLKYPYGRMILFSTSQSSKLILEDIALDENFKNLGNIDIFNPMKWDGIQGKGEVEGLMSIQDRINGMYNNYIRALKNHFSTIVVPKGCGITSDSLVKFPVTMIDNMQDISGVQVFTNDGIGEAAKILDNINSLQQYAYQNARVNETMLYGNRQTGTTSAEQVVALQESTMAETRGNQANFKTWIIGLGEKCVNFIKNKYTVNRLIKLSTNIDGAKFAQIVNSEDNERNIVLYNEASEEVKRLKFGEDLEFCVEVVAGTEVPRTRKEQASLVDNMLANGIFEKIKDLDMLEMYLKIQDVPNYRAIMQLMRKKQEDAQAIPPDFSWTNMFKNPELAKEFANLFDKLGGYSSAKQAMLEKVGLPPAPGKLDDTPVTDITSQSDVMQVATITPSIISNNPEAMMAGHDAATAEQLIKTL